MTLPQKFWYILTPTHRYSSIILLGLMLIGMLLETLGIALVIPVFAIMTQDDLPLRYPMIAPWLNAFGNPSHTQLIVAGTIVLVVVFVFKAFYLAFMTWRQMGFVYGVQATLSQQLFRGYLRQPYTFHLQRNSAQLIRNAVQESNLFTQSGLMSVLMILSELSVLCGISVLLIVIEPIGAVFVMSTFVLAGFGFHYFTRGYILRWGKARQYHDGLRIQYLQEGLGGAKEAQLLGREDDFLGQYNTHNIGTNRAGQKKSTLQALPRLFLESLAIIGLAILVLVMVIQGKPIEMLLPTLGLFGAAAFRLLPSVNRILGALQNLRYALPVVNTLHEELQKLDNTDISRQKRTEPMLYKDKVVLDQVHYNYPDVDESVLNGVSLSIPKGASVGFIGDSGAGKSTIIDIILGLLTPERGCILVDGIDVQSNLRGWQDLIGYVPQSIFLTDDTLRRNVGFGLSSDKIDDDSVWRAVRAAQLEQFVNDLPYGLETVVGERGVRLSGGQRQRIGIARALYHDPQVLVLDEATSSLDTDTEHEVMRAVTALKGDKTLIIVAHRLSTVENCDRLYRLKKGMLVEEGAPISVLRRNRVAGPG